MSVRPNVVIFQMDFPNRQNPTPIFCAKTMQARPTRNIPTLAITAALLALIFLSNAGGHRSPDQGRGFY
jgi:hypothetical protein